MTAMSRPPAGPDHVLATITRLVAAADGDTLYRDVYLRRAAELLAPIVSETQYEAALTTREQVNAVLAQARGAVGSQDWTKVREFGTRAAQLRRSLDDEQAALAAADAVYGAPAVVLDPLSPGIRISSPRWTTPEQARQQVSAMLAELTRDDAALSQFYAARQRTDQRAQCARRNRDDERHCRRGRPTAGARGARARRHRGSKCPQRRRCSES